MMYRVLIIIGVTITLISCGNDLENNTKIEVSVKDTTVSDQTAEFRAINDLLKKDINNTALYLTRANLYKKYGDLSSAVDDIDRALKIDSLLPEFYLLKAELLKQQDKLKEAKEALDKCMFIDNENLKARIELGWIALVGRNHKQALNYADAVLKRDVYNAEAYYLKGMVFQDKQDTAKAISSFITATEQENDYYDAFMQLGLLHFYNANTLAKEYLKNALRINPKSLEALYAYALVCQEKGDYNESIETYHKILEIDKYREAYFNLGFIHQEYLKVYDVAIDYYTKAIEVEPKYIDAYYNRGLCYEQIGDFKQSETDLRSALQLNPQYTFAAIALERVLNKKE